MKKGVISFFLLALILPSVASAHIEPIKTDVLWNQSVSIESITIDNDHNWFGSADAFFDTIVDAIDPEHDEQSYITDGTIEIDSGQTLTFDPPYEIYSHDTCHCDEEFDIQVDVYDHIPIKTLAGQLLEKGFDYLISYLRGGTTGLTISVIGDVLEILIDALLDTGMTQEEAEYQAYLDLLNESDHLGSMRHIIATPCEPYEASYTGDLEIEEVSNGELKYKIEKVKLDEACVYEEPEIGIVPDPEPEDATGDGTIGAPPPITDPDPADDIVDSSPEDDAESEPVDDAEPEEEEVIPDPEPVDDGPTYGPEDPEPADDLPADPVDDTPADDPDPADEPEEEEVVIEEEEDASYDCVGAARGAIDWGTGYYDPAVVTVSEGLLYWYVGPMACKSQDDVIASYAGGIQESIPSWQYMCPTLTLKSSLANNGADYCGIDFYFTY